MRSSLSNPDSPSTLNFKGVTVSPILTGGSGRIERMLVHRPCYPFSSFFNEFGKRQSVPWAMIFCGVDLIHSGFVEAERMETDRFLRARLAPPL